MTHFITNKNKCNPQTSTFPVQPHRSNLFWDINGSGIDLGGEGEKRGNCRPPPPNKINWGESISLPFQNFCLIQQYWPRQTMPKSTKMYRFACKISKIFCWPQTGEGATSPYIVCPKINSDFAPKINLDWHHYKVDNRIFTSVRVVKRFCSHDSRCARPEVPSAWRRHLPGGSQVSCRVGWHCGSRTEWQSGVGPHRAGLHHAPSGEMRRISLVSGPAWRHTNHLSK